MSCAVAGWPSPVTPPCTEGRQNNDCIKRFSHLTCSDRPLTGVAPRTGHSHYCRGRAQPCPVCGGKDRFRFDNLQGRGTWFCNQCGSGDGLNLVEKALAVTAKEAAVKVAGVLGEPSGNTLLEHNPQQEQQDKALARNNAAQQARQLLASARQQAGNAYLTAKGWPDTDALTLQGPSLRVGGITYQSGDLLVP